MPLASLVQATKAGLRGSRVSCRYGRLKTNLIANHRRFKRDLREPEAAMTARPEMKIKLQVHS